MPEANVRRSFVLSFTNFIILFSLVSFLLASLCHLSLIIEKRLENQKLTYDQDVSEYKTSLPDLLTISFLIKENINFSNCHLTSSVTCGQKVIWL